MDIQTQVCLSNRYRAQSWRYDMKNLRFASGKLQELLLLSKTSTGSGAHPASCSLAALGSFAGDKAAGSEAKHSPPANTKDKND
jgi:hypothetical protein